MNIPRSGNGIRDSFPVSGYEYSPPPWFMSAMGRRQSWLRGPVTTEVGAGIHLMALVFKTTTPKILLMQYISTTVDTAPITDSVHASQAIESDRPVSEYISARQLLF